MDPVGLSAVAYVGFQLTTDAYNEAHAVMRVVSDDALGADGRPREGGLYDARMGTTSDAYPCQTCWLGKRACLGHPALLDPRMPLCQPVALPTIRRWLKVVCFECGACVLPPGRLAALPPARRGQQGRLAQAAVAATNLAEPACPACRAPHPRVAQDREAGFVFRAEPPGPRGRGRGRPPEGHRLYPGVVRDILERVTDATVAALGLDPAVQHPRHLVLRAVPVPPTTTRPNARGAGGAAAMADATNMLHHMLRRRELLPAPLPPAMLSWAARDQPVEEGAAKTAFNQELLHASLVLGAGGDAGGRGGGGGAGGGAGGKARLHVGSRPLKGYMGGLAGKEGSLRGDLLGKRALYIARSTISGDCQVAVDEVGVPEAAARVLQVEETFQPFNQDRLLRALANGTGQYPGSTRLWKRAEDRTYAVEAVARYRPQPGDRLLRDLVDGDLVYINRQPTLEGSSMLVMRVRVVRANTLQLNVLSCVWFNADFDGDQMNFWAPRRPHALAEAVVLSSAQNAVVSVKKGTPVPGQAQDSLLGCYLMSRERAWVGRVQALQLFAGTRGRARLPAAPPRAGRALLSLLLPPVDLDRRPSSNTAAYEPFLPIPEGERATRVRGGRLEAGVLDKSTVGEGAVGGVNHLVALGYGPARALEVIYDMQQVAIAYATQHGFTCSMQDLLVGAACRAELERVVGATLLAGEAVAEQLERGLVVPPIGKSVHEFFEQLSVGALRVPDAEVLRRVLGGGELCYRGARDPLRADGRPFPGGSNGYLTMGMTGAKGSTPHILHVTSAVGPLMADGRRMPEAFSFRRTSPYFPRYGTSPAAYGFVRHSYMAGLDLPELLFGAKTAREDLVHKALSTADTGHLTRLGVMAFQSLLANNHRQVAADRAVTQLLYGDDGCDPRRLRRVRVRLLGADDAQLAAHAGGPGPLLERCRELRDWARRQAFALEGGGGGYRPAPQAPPALGEYALPFDAEGIVRAVLEAARPDGEPGGAPSGGAPSGGAPSGGAPDDAPDGGPAPAALAAALVAFCDDLPYVFLNERCRELRRRVPLVYRQAARLPALSLLSALGARELRALGPAGLRAVQRTVLLAYRGALVDYGAAVGIQAVHSVSEPLTQYMLDSHHRSTESGTSTGGLNRVNEILKVLPVSAERSSAMRLVLRDEVVRGLAPEAALKAAALVAAQLEFLQLSNFAGSWDVLYEAPGQLAYGPFLEDRAWLEEFRRAHPDVREPPGLTRWVLRAELNKTDLVLKGMSLETVAAALRAAHPGTWLAHTLESAPRVVLRLWYGAGDFPKNAPPVKWVDQLARGSLRTPIRGVPGVLQAAAREESRHAAGPGGALRREPEYVIRTVGTNLQDALLHSALDPDRSVTSSVGETCAALGIEASIGRVVHEMLGFMDSSAPSPRHLQIYALGMTRPGALTSLERHGLRAREGGNVLLGAVSATPVQVLSEAAVQGAAQPVYGFSAPIVLGDTPRMGAHFQTVVMNEEFVRAQGSSLASFLDGLDRLDGLDAPPSSE